MAVTLKQKRLAKDVFKSLCELFDENKFKYTKDKDRLCVDLVMQGDDIPIGLSIIVSSGGAAGVASAVYRASGQTRGNGSCRQRGKFVHD